MNRLNGLLCKHRLTLPTNVKVLVYNSYTVPVITYCHTVWGTTTQHNKNRLLIQQKRAIRLITNVPWNAHTEEYFGQLDMVRVTALYAFRLLCIYKTAVAMNNNLILSMFRVRRHETIYDVRHSISWSIPLGRTKYRTQSLSWNLPRCLNILEVNHFSLQWFNGFPRKRS